MLAVSNVSVAYGGSEVVHDVSFTVKERETVAIMGRNGMGKSTLLKSLMGLLPTRSGTVVLDGKPITKMASWNRVAAGVAFVPQGRMIFPSMTVEENIRTGLETVKERTIPAEIYQLFPILKEMAKRKGGNLSGGQQQQLAIARALVSRPKILILDEPTEGIQPSIIKDIARLLNDIKQRLNLAILVSEQVLAFTLDIADRFYVIQKGQLIHEEQRATVDADKIKSYLTV